MQKLIARMPLPNDYTTGDGLNTAGYRWVRRESGVDDNTGGSANTNRNQYNDSGKKGKTNKGFEKQAGRNYYCNGKCT